MIKDDQGRITKLESPGVFVTMGHSACAICGKDMPDWDAICQRCGNVVCRDHAETYSGKLWFCSHCWNEPEEEEPLVWWYYPIEWFYQFRAWLRGKFRTR